MEEITTFASVPAIMSVCYLSAETYKWLMSEEDGQIHSNKANAFIPILCAFIGMILGIFTYYQNPEVIHSDNVLSAAANGITSGLASLGLRNFKK